MLRVVRQFRSLFIASVGVLTLAFLFNVFGVQNQDWFNNFQRDSGALITHKIACHEALGKDAFGGMLVTEKVTDGSYTVDDRHPNCEQQYSMAYVSQFGLQGKASEVGYRILNGIPGVGLGHYIILLHIAWALLTAVVLSLFVVWMASRYGRFSAVSVLLLLGSSVWVVGFARNLYWATPLLFLPLIFTLYYYAKPGKTRRYAFFLGGLFVLFLLRFLNGFEFAPPLILSVVAAAGLVSYEQTPNLKKFFFEVVLIGLTGVVAFACAFGMTWMQVTRYVGSAAKARDLIVQRALLRTTESKNYRQYVYSGLGNTVPEVYAEVNNYLDLQNAAERKPLILTNLLWLLNYAALPVVNIPLPIREPVYTYISSFTFYVVLAWLAMRSLVRRSSGALLQKMRGLKRGLWMGLVASLSWLVFGYSHTLVHAHLNGIVYYLPFMLFAYVVLGLWLEQFVAAWKLRFPSKPARRGSR